MARASAVEAAPPSALVTLAKKFNEADAYVVELEEQVKVAKQRRATAEKKLVDEMITQQIPSFRTPFGGFRSEAVVYPNVINREALNEYVEKNKKLKFLYTIAVNGQKLKSYVKELLQQGEEIPPGIEPFTANVIRRFK